jgi:hypothetical protein
MGCGIQFCASSVDLTMDKPENSAMANTDAVKVTCASSMKRREASGA